MEDRNKSDLNERNYKKEINKNDKDKISKK